MAEAWLIFPALLLVLSAGCGLLVERVTGSRLPGALIPVAGLALIVVVGEFLTLSDATAELTTPVASALAVAGIGFGWREAVARVDRWAVAAALAAFAAFAAPIVLSGEATFAGYIRLDDTATWLALTDRTMEAGRSLDGLLPSSYEATLDSYFASGYPIGGFLPLGVVTLFAGGDHAWTIQPYMAVLGAMLALGLWQLAAPLVASRPLRALVAFTGSQAALLYGYYLWGGVKELFTAALVAAVVGLVPGVVASGGKPRALLALAVVCAAVIGGLSVGGLVWLFGPLVAALALLATRIGWRASVRPALWGIVLVAGLALPALANGGLRFATESPLTDAGELGNLFGPLQLWQVAGIWPAGDFRVEPEQQGLAYVLIGLAVAAGAGAAVHAWRRRAWPVLVYAASLLLACVPICLLGSPWVDAKALAGASPAIPFAAALAAAALYAAGRRIAGAIVIVAVLGGVLWSNALQYGGVNLAPRDQLAELEEIGDRFAGQGPTLMTEFQPYGVRHFLRDADPEGASELRRRQVPLADGGILEKGEFADTDRLDAAQLLVYRTLVLRRGPNQSRPPAAYDLAWTGDFYEVWQRLDPAPLQGEHLGLGIDPLPTARPDCADVRELAATAGTEGTLLGARRPPGIEVPFENAEYPPEWAAGAPAGQLVPQHGGEITATVDVPRSGDYDVWIGGSVRSRAELLIDGEVAGGVRHQLDYSGVFIPLGDAALSSGEHELTVRFGGPDLHPGSAGLSAAVGPLIVSSVDAAGAQVDRIPAEDAEERICGRSWDWIEVAG